MRTAEIVAWRLGCEIERELRGDLVNTRDANRLDWPQLTVSQARARFDLGDETFTFWVLRGALDSSEDASA